MLPPNLITNCTAKMPGDYQKQDAKPKPHWSTLARGKRRTPGQMNKTEAAYAAYLEELKVLGRVAWYVFEGATLKLAKDCRYTPDFAVMTHDGYLEFHEVKGFWRDDAKVKIRIAAERFPFRFVAVKARPKRDGGGWIEEEF